jgi:hypothetical protein
MKLDNNQHKNEDRFFWKIIIDLHQAIPNL